MFEKCDSSNQQKLMVASFSISATFSAKFELVLVLIKEKAFSQRFHFKGSRKSIVSSKKRCQGFLKIALHLRDQPYGSASFERFQYFNFEKKFLKNANPFHKQYRFLVERAKIKSATFPDKTAQLEVSVKANRMGSIKWTYQEERTFASNYFIFPKFCFSLRASCEELI